MCPAAAGAIIAGGALSSRSRWENRTNRFVDGPSGKVLQRLIVIGGRENVFEKSASHTDGKAECGTLGCPRLIEL